MNHTATSWTCQKCGNGYTSTPPDSGICETCTSQALCTCPRAETVQACPDLLPLCNECGGPLCPDCGQRLLLLIPVAAYADFTQAGGDQL
jgi:hypothetical protein